MTTPPPNDLPPVFRPKDNRPHNVNTPAVADRLQSFSEYRAHGGKLDFTGWEEKQEAKESDDGR